MDFSGFFFQMIPYVINERETSAETVGLVSNHITLPVVEGKVALV